jgi:hypothetical protein
MDARGKTLLGALEQVVNRLRGLPAVLAQAKAHAHEEILVRYVLGKGTFRDNGTYIAIDCKAYQLNGEEDGTYVGIDAPLFHGDELINRVLRRPHPTQGPYDTPDGQAGLLEHVMPLSYSKGFRTFPDGSTITAIGPANLHAAFYKDGASQFWVTSNLIITGGTGKYKEAQGLKTVAGSTWVEPGKPLTALADFDVKTVEVYRIIRKEFIGRLPGAGRPSAG